MNGIPGVRIVPVGNLNTGVIELIKRKRPEGRSFPDIRTAKEEGRA